VLEDRMMKWNICWLQKMLLINQNCINVEQKDEIDRHTERQKTVSLYILVDVDSVTVIMSTIQLPQTSLVCSSFLSMAAMAFVSDVHSSLQSAITSQLCSTASFIFETSSSRWRHFSVMFWLSMCRAGCNTVVMTARLLPIHNDGCSFAHFTNTA